MKEEVNDSYNKNCESLKKEIEDIRRWKNPPRSWISRINVVNWLTNKNNLYVQCNPHQNPIGILQKDRKINRKVHMEAQKTLNSQSNPEQKSPMLEVSQYLVSNYTPEPWQ
jgi:hypothetical protein